MKTSSLRRKELEQQLHYTLCQRCYTDVFSSTQWKSCVLWHTN